jgi:ubiquinone/menaquinone biosynthesis C-methylase UbiE
MQRLRDTKTELVARIISDNVRRKINRMLVVGCGAGVEAAILARCLEAEVVGVDVVEDFDPASARLVKLTRGDAMALEFEDGSFDFVYSYHALEHILNPIRALEEMCRVLKPSGGYWVGTPNRLRVIGYLGSKTATLREKVEWNIIDWKAKLAGRFTNELGAHAGFSASELGSMLAIVFSEKNDMTNIYYHVLYNRYQYFLRALQLSGLSRFLYPSVYFMGQK